MKSHHLLGILCAALFCILAYQSVSKTIDGSQSLISTLSYLIDSLDSNINEIKERPFSNDFDEQYYETDFPVWIRWEVFNTSTEEDFILTVDQWQKVSFYCQDEDGGWQEFASGTSVNVDERPESYHRLLTFPVHHHRSETKTYYLKVQNFDPLTKFYAAYFRFLKKIEWEHDDAVRDKLITNQAIISFIMGICFIMALYNGILFYYNPRKDLFYLMAYIILVALFMANIHGITTNYLFTHVSGYELKLGLILAHIGSILLGLYLRAYLKPGDWEIQNLLLWGYVGYMTISLIISLSIEVSFLPTIRRVFEGSFLLSVLGIGFWRKQEGTVFLLFAIFSSIVGRYYSDFLAFQLDMFVSGDVPYVIGQSLQLVFFTWGSTFTVRRLERKVKLALKEKQNILREQNDNLSKTVRERTSDLEDLSEKLIEGNSELRNQKEELRKTLKNLKDTQAQLIESEKMASLGMLSAGIGHEINNPLNFIKGGMTSLELNLEKSSDLEDFREKAQPMVKVIQEGINRTSSIVKSLSHFSRDTEQWNEKIDIHAVIENCLLMLSSQIKKSVVLEKDFTDSIQTIKGNEGKLHQVLLNILANAVQAIDGEGIINIKTMKNRKKITISISDNGHGIEKKNLNKISDPFFTTKPPGVGTGLGLSIAYSIIKEHNGTITCKSRVNQGTTFNITLPSYEQ